MYTMKVTKTHHSLTLRLSEDIFVELEAESDYSGNSIPGVIRHILAEHYAQLKYPAVSE